MEREETKDPETDIHDIHDQGNMRLSKKKTRENSGAVHNVV